ncbi:MAG: serine/threonine-protein phosphatase [Clostridia bacterium]|nr:serine/threonine-protein phosphatase [Clostridia bacterium]
MNVESIAVTHEGRVRENNEDNYFVCGAYKADTSLNRLKTEHSELRNNYIYAVCDGMGGEEHGEKASLIAVETLNEYWNGQNFSIAEYVQNANGKICNEIEKNNGTRMGTTLAVLYIEDKKACAYNIGDSRIYIFRNKKLTKLSRDHTQTERLVRMNILTPEAAEKHPERHRLTQNLGIFPEEMIVKPFESDEFETQKNDVFLLCSDGITDMLSDDEITNIISERKTLKRIAELLLIKALDKGGYDNLTFVLLRIC